MIFLKTTESGFYENHTMRVMSLGSKTKLLDQRELIVIIQSEK